MGKDLFDVYCNAVGRSSPTVRGTDSLARSITDESTVLYLGVNVRYKVQGPCVVILSPFIFHLACHPAAQVQLSRYYLSTRESRTTYSVLASPSRQASLF